MAWYFMSLNKSTSTAFTEGKKMKIKDCLKACYTEGPWTMPMSRFFIFFIKILLFIPILAKCIFSKIKK